MSKYTTGEIAKLCGVSVRTVQYYDSRNILVPTELSEGGRRLYSQADLNKLKLICFLRSLELPIDTIKDMLSQEHSQQVIDLLLQEQEDRLRREIAQKQESADRIAQTKKTLRMFSQVSVNSMGDMVYILENKKNMRRLYKKMLAVGLIMDTLQISTLMIWLLKGIWWPYVLGLLPVIGLGIWISGEYYKKTVYICPQCHRIFRPGFREAFWARHTPYTRKLTCRGCGYKGFCVETYGMETQQPS